jgi:hypothetical protein
VVIAVVTKAMITDVEADIEDHELHEAAGVHEDTDRARLAPR